MKTTLIVLGLIALSLVLVAIALRRRSGPEGYRRRFAAVPGFPRRETPEPQTQAAVWVPIMYTGGIADPGCSTSGHSAGDCGGGSAGVDGGAS